MKYCVTLRQSPLTYVQASTPTGMQTTLQVRVNGVAWQEVPTLYQETPKGIQMCATCTLYLPPSACKSVEGEVAASGWCKLFDMVD